MRGSRAVRWTARGVVAAMFVLGVGGCAQDNEGATAPLTRAASAATIYCDEQIVDWGDCEERPPAEGGGGPTIGSSVGLTGTTQLWIGSKAFSRTTIGNGLRGYPAFTASGSITKPATGASMGIAYQCSGVVGDMCYQEQPLSVVNCTSEYWTGIVNATHTGTTEGGVVLTPVYSSSGTESCGTPPTTQTRPTGGEGGGRECLTETYIVEISYDGGRTWYELYRFDVTICSYN